MAVSRRVKINEAGINELFNKLTVAVEKTAEETVTDLKNSATIPFDVGTLQLNTYWERDAAKNNTVLLVSNTPYARRLYFHPEYNFRTTNNANAGAGWFDPYISGNKKDFIQDTFAEFMKRG
jgi:hypothetical protein